MQKLPLIFGYLGTLPFLALMAASVLIDDFETQITANILHVIYGGMILSFLGGVHWMRGVPAQNMMQVTLSMGPTIFSLGLLIMAYLYNLLIPMIIMGALFWILYVADVKFITKESMPAGYFRFRLILTIIVSATFFVTAGSILFT